MSNAAEPAAAAGPVNDGDATAKSELKKAKAEKPGKDAKTDGKQAAPKTAGKGHITAVKVAALPGGESRCVITLKEKKAKSRDYELPASGPAAFAMLSAALNAHASGVKVHIEIQDGIADHPKATAITLS